MKSLQERDLDYPFEEFEVKGNITVYYVIE